VARSFEMHVSILQYFVAAFLKAILAGVSSGCPRCFFESRVDKARFLLLFRENRGFPADS